jgi:hypothetical protein
MSSTPVPVRSDPTPPPSLPPRDSLPGLALSPTHTHVHTPLDSPSPPPTHTPTRTLSPTVPLPRPRPLPPSRSLLPRSFAIVALFFSTHIGRFFSSLFCERTKEQKLSDAKKKEAKLWRDETICPRLAGSCGHRRRRCLYRPPFFRCFSFLRSSSSCSRRWCASDSVSQASFRHWEAAVA